MLVGFVAILDQIIQPYGVVWFLGFYNQKEKHVTFFFDTKHLLQHVLIKWLASQCKFCQPLIDLIEERWKIWKMDENCKEPVWQRQNMPKPESSKWRISTSWKILEICHQPTSGSVPPIKGGMPWNRLESALTQIVESSNSVRASVSMSCSSLESWKTEDFDDLGMCQYL